MVLHTYSSSRMKISSSIELNRYDAILAFACFVGALVLYIRTLTPGLLSGDSGEFQTLANLLGHTHPTGYPVYLVLAKMGTFIPFGDFAYRVNLFSGIMGALVVAAVYLCGRLLVKYHLFAAVGATVLAISPTFWSQAIIAEIYTAGAAFFTLILLTLLWWDQGDSPRALFIAGLLGGLSLGVHMSVALLAPAVLLFLLLHWGLGGKIWMTALMGAICGVFLTIFIFWLIDLNNPPANYFNSIIEPSHSSWGLAADEIDEPIERLMFGWSARQFRSFMFADIPHITPDQAAEYWDNLPTELSWLVVALAVIGAVVLLVRRWWVGLLLLAALILQLFYFFNYEIWDLYVFYIPSYILLILLAIASMGALADLGTAAIQKVIPDAQIRWVNFGVEILIALLVIGYALWPVFRLQKDAVLAGEVPFNFDEYPVFDENLGHFAYAAVLKMPENAIVFTDWDMVWPYYYTAHILEDRQDLTFIETYPADDVDGAALSVVDFVAANLAEHPIFFGEREQVLLETGFDLTPARLGPARLFRVVANE
jgi:4-amino-4-deoxy-L-arabinose transferase-like glycosyltransferase